MDRGWGAGGALREDGRPFPSSEGNGVREKRRRPPPGLGSVFRVFLGNGPKTACRAPPRAWKAGGVRVILPANKIRSPTKKPHKGRAAGGSLFSGLSGSHFPGSAPQKSPTKGEQTGSSIFYYLWSYVVWRWSIEVHIAAMCVSVMVVGAMSEATRVVNPQSATRVQHNDQVVNHAENRQNGI